MIITPIGAVDAIQRVPVDCWVGPSDHPAGFPNYPVWLAKAKTDRETGKQISRGGKTKAGR